MAVKDFFMPCRSVLLACLFVAASWAPSLAAQEKSPAEQLFWRGREAMKGGDYEAACQAFEQSVDLHPSAGAFLNLALSEERLGRNAKALEHFERVLALVDAKDERHTFALGKIRHLQVRTASSEMPAHPPTSNESEERPLNTAASAAAPVSSADRTADTRSSAAPNLHQSRSTPPALEVQHHGDTALAGWGFALAGAGATALGVSAVTGVMAMGMKNDALAHCNGRLCDEHGLAAADGARWYAAVSTGTLIGGLLSVGVASYLIVFRSRGTANNVTVGFSSAPGQGQVIVGGSLCCVYSRAARGRAFSRSRSSIRVARSSSKTISRD
jgi:hypothetical protein